jgi:hypothetical protein
MSRRYLEGVLRGGGETPTGVVAGPIAGLAGGALGGSPLDAPKKFYGVNEMSNTFHSSCLLGGSML